MVHRINPFTSERMTGRARELRRDSTIPERILWALLRKRRLCGLKFRRQAPVGPFVVDFLCEAKKLVVELDGMSHVGRGDDDDRRTEFLKGRGLSVVRVTNDQVLADIEMVAVDILRAVGMERELIPDRPSPGPSQGEGGLPSPLPSPGKGGLPSPQPSPKGRGG